MITGARFVHTNLVARDWRRLASFYETVFGCRRVPPERDYEGPALDSGTNLRQARLTGAHLRLPGYDETGPTLEIFTYSDLVEAGDHPVNQTGYGHIAFEVPSVADARQVVLSQGGQPVGEVVSQEPAPGLVVTWCYVRDPEGNVIELQSWSGDASGS